jgi:hypothetical protein
MKEYHKIQSVFKRDMSTKQKLLIEGDYSLPEFGYLANAQWTFTEKVDGTNIRVMVKDGGITFGGKTDAAHIPAVLLTRLQERFLPLTEMLNAQFPDGICFYGEGYGAKIQKVGGLYRADQDFVLFDARIGIFWMQRPFLEEYAEKLSVDLVPIVAECSLLEAIEMVKLGLKSSWGDFEAEGLVGKPKGDLLTRLGSRIITKLRCEDFKLLQEHMHE